ncbi:hypothetical protein E1N52_41300 [Paraburkholderia guartelaensis]|uniref:Uncharacterized protein n=1 Tax=Paraburkholderia guartelaensis TaxID=2546446 RepID=A0A4R5L1G1_9BURK|nr:hypothetical protein [Paraburkholderia guartelaensis]TDG02130.1 hypothetical protein E1N52_41300 [Paraburkholderia guartelaensis]
MFRQAENDFGPLIQATSGNVVHDDVQPTAGHALMIATLLICWWSLVETALDFVTGNGNRDFASAIAANLIVVIAGLAVVMNVRFAREIFAFLCGVSILALGSRLPLAFGDSLWMPLISLVDCGSKLVFLAFACAPPHENGTRAASL